jgi:hypothetical protein
VFVHDDEPERFELAKSRAGADDNARASLPDLVPFVMPLAYGEMRMQHGHERLRGPELKRALNRSTVCVSAISARGRSPSLCKRIFERLE